MFRISTITTPQPSAPLTLTIDNYRDFSIYMRTKNSERAILDLALTKISDSTVMEIGMELLKFPNPNLVAIDLSHTKIGLLGAKALALMMTSLTPNFNLILENIGMDDEAAESFALALRAGRYPENFNLNISGNDFTLKGCLVVVKALESAIYRLTLTTSLGIYDYTQGGNLESQIEYVNYHCDRILKLTQPPGNGLKPMLVPPHLIGFFKSAPVLATKISAPAYTSPMPGA